MIKSLIFLAFLSFLVSCNDQSCKTSSTSQKEEISKECPAPSEPTDPTDPQIPEDPTDPTDPETPTDPEGPTEPTDPGDIPNDAFKFDFNVTLFKFDAKDEEKVYKAFEVIKQVVRSDAFKSRVYNHTYQSKKQFVDNLGLTNEQIYQTLLDGSEKLTPGIDNEVDLELELYYKNNNTIGYTYASKTRVWMNTKFFDQYTPAQVARNVFHEWTHKLGFKHDSDATTRRKYSVPYGVGKIIEELGKQYE